MQWKKVNSSNQAPEKIWGVERPNGKTVYWKGFTSGPLTLNSTERKKLYEQLLPIGDEMDFKTLVAQSIRLASGKVDKSLILHSTTPYGGSFEGDLAKLLEGKQIKNYTGYAETRSVFLGKVGDLAVGRMKAWKETAKANGLDMADIGGIDYYHLVDVLLQEAANYLQKTVAPIQQIIDFLQEHPQATVRLYGLGKDMLVFLLWLKNRAGLEAIYIDANSPKVAEILNCKNILYPGIETAQQLPIDSLLSPNATLEEERKYAFLSQKMGLNFQVLPGYTIQQQDRELSNFIQQIVNAAQLLQQRYGLEKGCLKAASAGDGGNITPNIDLQDTNRLTELAKSAYTNQDDYVLEAQVEYRTAMVGNQKLKLTPSVHIREGELADGMTLQFTTGTSWSGNLYMQESLAEKVGISSNQYRRIRQTMADFLAACKRQNWGLTIAGLDFAIGQVGGKLGEETLLAVQDPNISFNGAEFLRVFMAKIQSKTGWKLNQFYAATRVFVPTKEATLASVSEKLPKAFSSNIHIEVIAIVPQSWGMIGVAALEFEDLLQYLENFK